jgi:mono/diheme cytochrome c family protein
MCHDLRRWVIATRIVPLLLLFVVASSCAESSDETEAAKPEISAETIAAGQALFDDWACAMCHGDNREGAEGGPPLRGLDAHWTVETLAEYISDPSVFVDEDPRLQKVSESYPDSEMPAFDVFPAEERRALAAYLLAP